MPFDTSLYKKVFQKFTPHLDPFHPVSHYGCDGGEDHGQQHVQDQDADDPPRQVEQATMLDGWRSAALIVAKFVRNCFTTHLVCISAPRRRRWGRQFSPLSQVWMFVPINIVAKKSSLPLVKEGGREGEHRHGWHQDPEEPVHLVVALHPAEDPSEPDQHQGALQHLGEEGLKPVEDVGAEEGVDGGAVLKAYVLEEVAEEAGQCQGKQKDGHEAVQLSDRNLKT